MMLGRRSSSIVCALPLLAASLASACVAPSPPKLATPPPQLPAQFSLADKAQDHARLGALLPEDDPGFVALASKALASSPTLGEAIARIDAARAGAKRAGAERLPAVGVNASVTATRTNPAQFGSNFPAAIQFDTERASYAANLTARWDSDIFGQLKARKRAALARLDAASAGAQAVRLALISEVAASVIDWRTLDARYKALRSDADAAVQLARLAAVREKAGLAPGFDRIRAEATAKASQSRIAGLASERNRLAGRLVTLTAQQLPEVLAMLKRPPHEATLAPVPRSLPSQLLLNRPDILMQQAALRAADADLAATARRRFPLFDLGASIGLLAFNPSALFDSESLVGSLAASIATPLIDFGRIESEIDAAAAQKREAFHKYRGAVYTALGDAETAYRLVESADSQLAAAKAEALSAEDAAKLAGTRYRAGLADFLTVLDARRAADASGERAAAALGNARRVRILLWQALGGSEFHTNSRSTSQ